LIGLQKLPRHLDLREHALLAEIGLVRLEVGGTSGLFPQFHGLSILPADIVGATWIRRLFLLNQASNSARAARITGVHSVHKAARAFVTLEDIGRIDFAGLEYPDCKVEMHQGIVDTRQQPRTSLFLCGFLTNELNIRILRVMTMRSFSSLDLQQQSGEIQRAAAQAPVVITSHGKPRVVVMSVDEFRRLKTEAGEEVPAEARPRQPTVLGPEPEDLLGYDERDPVDAVLHMAKDAIGGINQDLVRQEADRFAKHFVQGAK